MSDPAARSSWLIRGALLPVGAGVAVMGWMWTRLDDHGDGIAFAVASWVVGSIALANGSLVAGPAVWQV